MKKNVFIITILIMLLTLNAVSATEHTESSDTESVQESDSVALASITIDEYNNLYYPQSFYNDGLNFKYDTETQEAYINPATGSTNVVATDVVLPGVNGFDLEITRTYNSLNSMLYETYMKQDGSLGLISETAHERYSVLGTGWEFTFPYIENRYDKESDDYYIYLHFGTKGVWLIEETEPNSKTYFLLDYPLDDINIYYDSSVYHNGASSYYRVDEKDGTKHYFALDGRLLIQEDRYGNQIKYYSLTAKYTDAWGTERSNPVLSKIIDTAGRVITFTEGTDDTGLTTDRYVYVKITDPDDSGNEKNIFTH